MIDAHHDQTVSKIKLEPMTKEEYSKYMIENIRRYAEEGVKSGRWVEGESLEQSEKSIKESLPKGMRTKNNFFYNVLATSSREKVGVLWLAVQDTTLIKTVFVFDILIYEDHQNKGLGTETMMEIERWSKNAGAKTILLHAFSHNQRAISLYRRLGYSESDVMMTKRIGSI